MSPSRMHKPQTTSIPTCHSHEWIVEKETDYLQLESTPKGCIPDCPLSRGFGINAFGKSTWSGLMHLGNRRIA